LSTNAGTAGKRPDDFVLVASGGGGDTIGVDMPVNLLEPETQQMDIDTVPNASTSNEAGTAIHKNDRTSAVVSSVVAGENSDSNAGGNGDDVAMRSEHGVEPAPAVANSDENAGGNGDSVAMRSEHVVELVPAVANSDDNAGGNGDDVAMRSEHGVELAPAVANSDENASGNGDDVAMRSEHMVQLAPAVANSDENAGGNGNDIAMRAPAVVKAPANKRPIRYLDGVRVSEYEWNRSENIKANDKLLQALELKNAGGRIFGKQDGKKGKENKDNGGEPSAKCKKIPLANTGTRTLRSIGKAVTNRCVYMVVDGYFIADSPAALQR
jgi:hypothetical protein